MTTRTLDRAVPGPAGPAVLAARPRWQHLADEPRARREQHGPRLLAGQLLRPLDDTALTVLMAVPTATAAIWVVATGRLTPVTQPPR